jgi:hypothetical protein
VDLASWSVGLALIVLTIAIHTSAVVLMALGLETRLRVRGDPLNGRRLRTVPTMVAHIGAVALILAGLHGLEGALWGLAYRGLGTFDSLRDASIYALATMTTFDIPAFTVPARFRMLSALEAVNGVLLFGISTAFLFAVIQAQWKLLSDRHGPAETQ